MGNATVAGALATKACDYVMPDVSSIGGVSGWIQAAGIAAAHGIEMSSHRLPEISAHLLAASPTRHYLEYVDWADAILEEPLQIQDGLARVPDHRKNSQASGPIPRRLARSAAQEPVCEPIYNDLPTVEDEDVVYQHF
jgi:hypothetical protein